MLQAYALQKFLSSYGYETEIVDFSSKGQREIYSVFSKNSSLKKVIRNVVLLMVEKRIIENNKLYEIFKRQSLSTTSYATDDSNEIIDDYYAVIAGADQIWNVTIADFDDAYFLNWVTHAKKIAYAPSFGARDISIYAEDKEKYRQLLNSFDYLSIREYNGQKWISDFVNRTAPVVLDPTLLLCRKDYEDIMDDDIVLPKEYIFYYSPSYSFKTNSFVKKISLKYHLPVIAFNTKSYCLRAMNLFGFKLPSKESPNTYLKLMKNAKLVITTSFHGTIFSTIFRKKFWVIKNGCMFDSDDRVATLVDQLAVSDRVITAQFDGNFDYLQDVSYDQYIENLEILKKKSTTFLLSALGDQNETTK